jgi:hypothetical protein
MVFQVMTAEWLPWRGDRALLQPPQRIDEEPIEQARAGRVEAGVAF